MSTPFIKQGIAAVISVGAALATILITTLGSAATTAGETAAGAVASAATSPATSAAADSTTAGKPASQIPGIVQVNPQFNGGTGEHPNTAFNNTNIFCNGLPYPMVNTATLGLVVEDIVFRYKGLGPGVMLKMTYNSGSRSTGMFGQGWRFAYESEIREREDVVEVWRGSGQVLTFRQAAPVSPHRVYPVELIPPPGIYDRLHDYGQYWSYAEKSSRLIYIYNRNSGQPIARLNAIRDLDGNTVNVQYNADGTLATLTDAAGRLTQFLYDGQGHCAGFRIPDGRSARCVYDGSGFLVQAVDLLGIIASYGYDPEGKMITLATDRDQRTNRFSYQNSRDGACLAGVTNPNGGITRYEIVSEDPRQVRVTDPGGLTTQYSSHNGLTTQVVDPSGASTSYTYTNNLLTSRQTNNGRTYNFTYDTRGNQVRVVDPSGKTWQFSYDGLDLLTAETDPDGNTFQYTYNDRGHLVKTLSPEGRSETFTYDTHGLLSSVGMVAGGKIESKYDAFGNVTSLIDRAGNTTRMSYDPSGLSLQATTDRRGNTTRFGRDLNDRLTQITFPDGSHRQFTYSCWAGTGAIDENGNTWRYKRDGLLQLTEQTDAIGNSLLSIFDQSGRLARLVDLRGQAYGFQYDTNRREIRSTNPLGHNLMLQSDPEGNLMALTDESGNISHYRYDPLDRLVSITQPNGDALTFQRDSTGKVKSVQNARGQTIAYEYDRDGFVARKTFAGKAAASYRIGSETELTQMTDAGGSTDFQYDAAGRVSGIQYPGELKAGFNYDPNGNLITIEYPGNQVVRYSYDLRNRPIRVEWGQHFIACQYDPAGNLLSIARSNGFESAYTYNPNGLVTGVKHNGGGQILADIRYTRDAASNLTAESGSYPLEPVATEPASRAAYNSVNQLTSLNKQPYHYDADGNLESIGVAWQASYDPENRMTELNRNGETLSHTYNGDGRLSEILKEGNVRHFYYDPFGRLLFETNGQNQLSEMIVYLGNRLVALVQPDGQNWFYHFNAQGSTLALTNSEGEIAAAYSYNPYGACTPKAGSVTGNPFTFVGEFGVLDEGEGLYFMKNRHYDAFSGRFLQQDPIGIRGGTNLYAYTAGNPTSRIDPEGTVDPLTMGLIAMAVIGIFYKAYELKTDADKVAASTKAQEKEAQDLISGRTDTGEGYIKTYKKRGAETITTTRKGVELGVETTTIMFSNYVPHGGHLVELGAKGMENLPEGELASSTTHTGIPTPTKCPSKPSSFGGGVSSGGGGAGASW